MSGAAFIPDTVLDDAGDAQNAPGPSIDPMVPPELIEQALGPTFRTIFNSIASFRGQHWALKQFEQDALVKGWSPIVQIMLAKLGSSEQVMLSLAMVSTAAIVGGKVAQDATKRASSMANIRTQRSGDSSVSSASAAPASQPAQDGSYQEQDE